MIARRDLLLAGLAATALTAARRGSSARPARLGIQLYMMGPDAARDLPATLAAIARIGFREVELPGLLGRTAQDMAAMLRAAGLSCPSLHIPLRGGGLSLADPEAVARTLDALGARFAVVPMPPIIPRPQPGESWFAAMARTARAMTSDDWRRIAGELDRAGRLLAPRGMSAGYHNHDLDLRPIAADDGRTPLDLLIDETNPRHVVFEMDIGWVAAAGGDPAGLLRRHGARYRLLHLKDAAARASPDTALRMEPADPGAGIVDWPAVMRALRDVPIAHFFVEQEPPFVGPRIESARRAHDFFTSLLR